jgi:hypothetical protein
MALRAEVVRGAGEPALSDGPIPQDWGVGPWVGPYHGSQGLGYGKG